MEILAAISIICYVVYLRYYADLRPESDKELARLQVGIKLFHADRIESAKQFFDEDIRDRPQGSMAYLYRARCQLKLGNPQLALADLRTSESYDDTVADTHLEIGRLLYDRQEYDAAFTAFDRAVFHSRGQDGMVYYWRGVTRQKLNQSVDAQHDLDRAIALEHQTNQPTDTSRPASAGPFLDKKLLINAAFVLLNSVLLLLVIKRTPVVHGPYLLAAASAAVIGFAEPRKGWSLALLQAVGLWVGYTFFTETPTRSGQRELEAFGLYGATILSFVGSFIGGVLKRAMNPR
jgi:tetratricopeptide (TPR) repeat protein